MIMEGTLQWVNWIFYWFCFGSRLKSDDALSLLRCELRIAGRGGSVWNYNTDEGESGRRTSWSHDQSNRRGHLDQSRQERLRDAMLSHSTVQSVWDDSREYSGIYWILFLVRCYFFIIFGSSCVFVQTSSAASISTTTTLVSLVVDLFKLEEIMVCQCVTFRRRVIYGIVAMRCTWLNKSVAEVDYLEDRWR